MADRWSNRAADEDLAHVTQHVVPHAFGPRRIYIAVDDLQSIEGVGGESEQCGKDADFNHHNQDRRRGRFNDTWIFVGRSGIEFHYASRVRDRFHTGKREHDSDEREPVLTKRSVQRLEMSERSAEMGQTKKSERNDNDDGGDRNQEGESARLLRP